MDYVETTTDTHAVTKFVEPSPVDSMTGTYKTPEIPASDVSSIADFLARPVLQLNTFWQTTQAAGTDIIGLGIGLPSDGFLETNPMFVDKLKGYNLISATINYRIQINSNPFQQGKLLAHFLPFQEESGALYKAMRQYNLTTKTQQPSVDVDCRGGGAEITVPYLAPTTHYELHTGSNPKYERGRLHLSVLSPLKTGPTGTQDVEVAVWTYFTDVELRAPIVPQSDAPKTKARRGKFKGKKIGAVKAEKNVMMESKVISKGLSAGGMVAKALAVVPSLAEIAAPAAWVLDTMAGVAASLGYSKPDVDIVPAPFASVYDKYAATSDGADPAVPLSCLSTNALSRGVYSYTDDDEMSMAFLLSREALIDTFEMTTSSIHDSAIYTKALEPSSMVVATPTTVGTNTQNVLTGPPLAYLSTKFKFWRGGIKLRFSIVKTEMQSGRVQVTYTPMASATITEPTVDTGSYSIRQVIDITTEDELVFCVPYMASTMYLEVGQAMGTVQVRVINQLRAPEAAATSIQFLVYASACEDFEYAVPCSLTSNTMPLVPQADETLDSAPAPSLDSAEACVGERILSVRQMIRFTSLTQPATVGLLEWWPFSFGYSTQNSDPSDPLTVPEMSDDLYSYIGSMYALYRGGVDVLACSNQVGRPLHMGMLGFRVADNDAITQLALQTDYTSQSTVAGTTRLATGINPRPASDNISVLAVPYYNRFPVSLVTPTLDVPSEASRPPTSVVVNASGAAPVYSRRIREDFQFSLFVGCPPYIVPTEA